MKRITLYSCFLLMLALSGLLTSCGLLPFFANTFAAGNSIPAVSFDIENATAIAGTESAARTLASISPQARAALSRASAEDAALVKIMEDGSLKSAIDFGANGFWQPNISFLSVGDDGSVYICFESVFQSYEAGQPKSIQFVRVYPSGDIPYDVLWPLDPANYVNNTDGQVQTWNWWGMDTDPLAKGPDGKLYFIVNKSSFNSQEHVVYRYDPATGDTPVAVTPTGTSIQISTFQVDFLNRIFVQSESGFNTTSRYLRYYYPNITAPTNIYYSSDSSTWVRGYTTDPFGRFLILNGYGINKRADGTDQGLSGIIKVKFDTTDPTAFTFQTMYPSGGVYARLAKWVDESWESGTEILVYDPSDSINPWSWHEDVLTAGQPDPAKVLGKISNLYMDTPTQIYSLPDESALNNSDAGYSRLGDLAWSYNAGSIPFLDRYFDGQTLDEYLSQRGYSGLTLDCLGKLLWLTDGSLYGLYDSSWWGGNTNSNGKIIKLLDSNGDRDLEIIELEKGDQLPALIKISGDLFFYRYSDVNNLGIETGTHKLAWVNPVTGEQNTSILPADVPPIELIAYDVTSDNQALYFVGFDASTNSVLSGKVNLNAGTWERLVTAARLTKIRAIN